MLLLLAIAAVWGATVVPVVLLCAIVLERRQAARRLAELDSDAPYETRLRAEHAATLGLDQSTRRVRWGDLASPRAVIPSALATLLALTRPLDAGWGELGLLIGVIGSVVWWSSLRRSGVKHASAYASMVWCIPAMVFVAMMLLTGASDPSGDDTPWHYQIWNSAVSDPLVPALVLASSLILMPLAFYSTFLPGLGRFAIVLSAAAVIPLATVVLATTFGGAALAALAVGLIGFVMSRSSRRVNDAARARIKAEGLEQGDNRDGFVAPRVDSGDVILGAAFVLAVVVAMNVLSAIWRVSVLEGDWWLRVALVVGCTVAAWAIFIPRRGRDASAYGVVVTFAALFALSLQSVGSSMLAAMVSPGNSVGDFAFPGVIYLQVTALALAGLLLFAWSAARRRSAEYAALAIGFAWPVVIVGMLGLQLFDGTNLPLQVQAWLPVSMAAPLVIATMRFVSGGDSLALSSPVAHAGLRDATDGPH